jgi:hypothetical protein
MADGSPAPSVFINCPFDDAYRPLFEATVFTVAHCGFAPRCALETVDAAGTRIDRIMDLIGKCPLGIHDISRTESEPVSGLPRFNMPFELGLFLGARRFGNRRQKGKNCLILDTERYRYQKFLSDIAGQDIDAHGNDPAKAITKVRDFLRTHSGGRRLPGGAVIKRDFAQFEIRKPVICAALELDPGELTFVDFAYLVAHYLNPAA